MTLSFTGGKIEGRISPPPSKSHTHRAFFLAAMADGTSRISNALLSADTKATLAAVESIGADVRMEDGSIIITGGDLHAPDHVIDADNSGTTMRIFAGLSSMFSATTEITGDESLRKRPMQPLLDALADMGVSCASDGGRPPVRITGPNNGGPVSIDGTVSSQFITSLMMAAPMLSKDTNISIRGGAVSAPYLNVTASMMKRFGANVFMGGTVHIRGGTGYKPFDYNVPADFSSAAFPLVAGALGGTATVCGVDMSDPQGDRRIVDILRDAGAEVTVDGDALTTSMGPLKGCDVDMGDIPDLFPIVAVLLSTAEGTSRLHGAPQLRFKESDRIESTVRMLNAIGADATETEDGCVIRGRDSLSGGHVDHRGDHRIMMSAAIASIVCKKPVTMDDGDCCAVSFPEFPKIMSTIGLGSEEN
jgi:3-phosphoshikimate 1-carboxyvinyltransferase